MRQSPHSFVYGQVMMARPSGTGDGKLYVGQLTSLRGIACMVVLIGHVIQVIKYNLPPEGSFLHNWRALITGAFNAEGAVLLFFVLSGCVLCLSLKDVPAINAPIILGFYVKRLFRLYPLLWVASFIAMISLVATRHLVDTCIFVDWLTRNLHTRLTAAHTILSLTGLYTRYNGPMWSLRVELIYSALFPAIYLLVRNIRLRWPFIALLTIVALLPIPSQLGTAYALSFAVGALIPFLPAKQVRHQGVLVLLALTALLYDRAALGGLHPPERVYDIIETTASFFIVRDIYAAGRSYLLLTSGPVLRLGELSFSIYLLHMPIFLILFSLVQHFTGLSPLLNNPAIAQFVMSILTASVTIYLSFYTYRYVELPLHNIGRSIGGRIARHPGAHQKTAVSGKTGADSIIPIA